MLMGERTLEDFRGAETITMSDSVCTKNKSRYKKLPGTVPAPARGTKMFGYRPDIGPDRRKVRSDQDRPMRKFRIKFVRMTSEPLPYSSPESRSPSQCSLGIYKADTLLFSPQPQTTYFSLDLLTSDLVVRKIPFKPCLLQLTTIHSAPFTSLFHVLLLSLCTNLLVFFT